MKNSLYLLFLALFCCISCRKDDDNPTPLEQLPAETQEGRDTFGCLVNGKAWVNSGAGMFTQDLSSSYSKGSFFVHGKQSAGKSSEGILLHIEKGMYFTGTYLLSDFPNPVAVYTKYDNNNRYETDSVNTGTLEITRLDTINFIVSGRFSFTVAKEGCDTIRVTDGRFDVRYGR